MTSCSPLARNGGARLASLLVSRPAGRPQAGNPISVRPAGESPPARPCADCVSSSPVPPGCVLDPPAVRPKVLQPGCSRAGGVHPARGCLRSAGVAAFSPAPACQSTAGLPAPRGRPACCSAPCRWARRGCAAPCGTDPGSEGPAPQGAVASVAVVNNVDYHIDVYSSLLWTLHELGEEVDLYVHRNHKGIDKVLAPWCAAAHSHSAPAL